MNAPPIIAHRDGDYVFPTWRDALADAQKRIPDSYAQRQRVFRAASEAGLSYREIGQATGLSAAAVGKIIARDRVALDDPVAGTATNERRPWLTGDALNAATTRKEAQMPSTQADRDKSRCPRRADHNMPDFGYCGPDEAWMRENEQVRCEGCGFYVIAVPRPSPTSTQQTPDHNAREGRYMTTQTTSPMSREQRIETIARACHEANRAWCEAHGDMSQKVWTEAEPWQRESAIAGVSVAIDGATPEQQHQAWCDHRIADGWVYGPVKDAERKTHPCLVEYDRLPSMQRIKDDLYGAVVRTLAPALGLTQQGGTGSV